MDQTYRARHPVFAVALQQAGGLDADLQSSGPNAGQGVQVTGIVESEAPLRRQYEPSHPMADADGFVAYPNVNVVEEMTNMISASRSFQTSADIMNSAKEMMQRVLTLGQS